MTVVRGLHECLFGVVLVSVMMSLCVCPFVQVHLLRNFNFHVAIHLSVWYHCMWYFHGNLDIEINIHAVIY